MAKVHRVGDFDTSGAMSSTGSENVFANGGPTLGGGVSEVFGPGTNLLDAIYKVFNMIKYGKKSNI